MLLNEELNYNNEDLKVEHLGISLCNLSSEQLRAFGYIIESVDKDLRKHFL